MTAAYYDDPNYKYGNINRHYDEQPADFDANRFLWRFEVAWTGGMAYHYDGDGNTEANLAIDCYWTRGRSTLVNYEGVGLTMFPPGRMVITLLNNDGRYDRYNTGSPLYPNVTKGKFCRLGVVTAGNVGLDAYIWRFSGYIVDIRTYRDENGESYAELTIQDGWGWLQDRELYLNGNKNKNAIDLLAAMLKKLGWPAGWLRNDCIAAVEPVPYFWCSGLDARTGIGQLAEITADHVWISGDGAIHYRNRKYGFSSAATITQSDVFKNIFVINPDEYAYNVVKLHAFSAYNSTGLGLAWGDRLQTPPQYELMEKSINAGDILILEGTFPGEFIRAAYAPEEILAAYGDTNQDYLLWFFYRFTTGTGRTGSDVSGYVSLEEFLEGGSTFRAKLKNNYSATVYSAFFFIWGASIVRRIPGKDLWITDDRSGGIGQKKFSIESPFFAASNTMSNIATALGNDLSKIAKYYADILMAGKILPILTLENQPTLQFREVYDRVLIQISKLSINDSYRIGRLEERWLSPNGQRVQTKIYTEPYVEATA